MNHRGGECALRQVRFRSKLIPNLGRNVSKRFFTYLSTFDVPTFTGKPTFRWNSIRNHHQFYWPIGKPLLHHSEIIEQLVNRPSWQFSVFHFDD